MNIKKKIIAFIIGIEMIVIAAVIVFLFYINSDTVKMNRQLELAQRYLLEEDYEQAIAAFEVVIGIDPKNAEAYLGLAEAYAATDDVENVVKILERGSKRTDSEEIKKMLKKHTEETEQKEFAAQRAAEAAQEAADAVSQQEAAVSKTSEQEMVNTGFITQDGELYYYDEAGRLVTGWFDANSNRYCAREDGRLYKNGEHEIDSMKYLFDPSGICLGEAENEQDKLFAEEDARLFQTLNTNSDLTELMTQLVHAYVGEGNTQYNPKTSGEVQGDINKLLSGKNEGIETFFCGGEMPLAMLLNYTNKNQPENFEQLYELSYNECFLTTEQAEYLIYSVCGKQMDIDFASYDNVGSFTWMEPYIGFGGAAGDMTWSELHNFSVERVDASTWKVTADDMFGWEEDSPQFVARICFTVIKNTNSCFDGYSLTYAEVELMN